jgi:uncharacterized protein (DUF1015 family)
MEIKPFKAFRFDESVVGDVGKCVAPPYDVISAEQQEHLYQKSEYNIVRVTRGKITPADSDTDNQYTRAAECLKNWMDEGVLKQDSTEAIYGYVQDFHWARRHFQRFSFVALGELEEFGKTVLPHEQIMNEPMIDRISLKKATRARFGLVFMLYDDDGNIADKIIEKAARERALIDFVDEQHVRHRLFAITAKDDIGTIVQMMGGKSCIIADGHHRYTTGLTLSKENADPAAKYQMLAFSNTRHEGLVVLATHRVVNNLEKLDLEKLLTDLTESFEMMEYSFDSPQSKTDARQRMLEQMKAEHHHDGNAFGIYGGHDAFYVAVLKDKMAMDAAAPQKSAAWRSLDVAVLHKLVLERLLDIGEKKLAAGGYLEYVKDTSDAVDDLISQVDNGQKQVVFFMNPPRIEQIRNVAEHGERMPQKSTYFYPKVFTGLTIQKL